MNNLAIGDLIFAMRPCEYVHVMGTRRTKPLRLWDLPFFWDNKVMAPDDPYLQLATALSITFQFQKTDIRHKRVDQHATEHIVLCPVSC
jgi:hypothetical protein